MSTDDPENPHFRAEDPSTWAKPAEVTWGDHMGPRQGKPLSPRHIEIARLLSLGHKTSEIARIMGMEDSRVSILRSNAQIMREVQRFQERTFEETIEKRMKRMGSPAAGVLEEILLGDDPNVKPQLKAETARWIIEKLTGRPKQEIDIGSQTISNFLTLIEEMRAKGEIIDVGPAPVLRGSSLTAAPAEGTAVTETAAEPESDARRWVKENFPGKD